MERQRASSLELSSPVQYLKGVGPVRAQLLRRLGIDTVEELLHHYPHDYLVRASMQPLSSAKAGESITTMGRLLDLSSRRTRAGRTMITALLADGPAKLHLTWFNANYLERYLHLGDEIVVSGDVGHYHGRLQIVNPAFESTSDQGDLAEGRPLARYPLTAGIKPGAMRGLVGRALDTVGDQIVDPVPPAWTEAEDLPPLAQALESIHRPANLDDVDRARRRLAFDEALALQLSVGARRRSLLRRSSAWRVKTLGELSRRYVEGLGFELTGAQRRALKSIREDLAKPHAMHRLLQGDVGCGKTVVAIVAMIWMAESGGQAAFMAPTEVLARQHAERHAAVLDRLGIRSALLTGSTPAARRREILVGLASGEIQLAFGTHALIQEGVEFARLGLAVVDEQHRFGVLQRAALSGGGAHMLVMSATPIPRSLALTVFADLDLSIIDELPPGRTPVDTRVVKPGQLEEIYRRLHRRIADGERAFLVFPLVEDAEEGDEPSLPSAEGAHAELSAGPLKGLRVGLLHGQLPAKEKARVSEAFAAGELDVLVATTVIEVGIDVPEASVMVIHSAERFGLAQLHQLRGRVGRGVAHSYCLLVAGDQVGEVGWRRLSKVASTHDGFVLAEADLRERGMGDLMGLRQHGEMHLKMLNPLLDSHFVERARQWAEVTLEADPTLTAAAHRPLALWLDRLGRRDPFWSASG